MADNWVFNSSVRNPTRWKPSLAVLADFEGETWDDVCKVKFMKALAARGPYGGVDFTAQRAAEWVGPLNKLGFCESYTSRGRTNRVVITPIFPFQPSSGRSTVTYTLTS